MDIDNKDVNLQNNSDINYLKEAETSVLLKNENADKTVNSPKKSTNTGINPQDEQAKRRKRKIISTILFLLVNAVVILILVLMEDNTGEMEPFSNIKVFFIKNWYFFAIAYSLFWLVVIGDTVVFHNLTRRMRLEKSLKVSLMTAVLGRYYDRITPMSTGGEPFQMAYLMSSGIKASDSCAITMSRHIIRFFITATAVIIILAVSNITTNVWVMVVAIIGVLGGLIVPVFMIVCCFKPKFGKAIGRGVIKLLFKLKLVKDYDKQLNKLQDGIDNFLKGITYLSANKKIIVIIGLVSLIELFANNAIPYFIMRGLDIDLQFWYIFVLCIFVNYASSIAPTPGGAGLAELSFYAIFAKYIGGGYIFWAVLTWRLAYFYVPIAVGFIVQMTDSITGLIKSKRSSE